MRTYYTLLLIALLNLPFNIMAQNTSLGIGGPPHSSAQLDIKSTTGGLLIPQMTSTQRQAITNPANGLMVFDSDTKTYWYMKGNNWSEVQLPLPFSATMSSPASLFSIENTHTISQATLQVTAMSGTTLQGTANGTYSGIFGQNDANGKGVTGHNTANGTGVFARGMNGTGLFADILNGYGDAGHIKQINAGGMALDVQGNVRIHGGNNAEGIGKNLQCANNGDGFWIRSTSGRIHAGFVAKGFATNGLNTIPNSTWSRYHPRVVDYNFTDGFKTAPASAFVCPVNGLYKFNATIKFTYVYNQFGLNEYVTYNGIRLRRKHNGIVTTVVENTQDFFLERVMQTNYLSIENHVHLDAGDEVWIEIIQTREYSAGVGGPANISFGNGSFSGNIVWADPE